MKLYFDMDGVLADFDRGVIEMLQLIPRKQGLGKKMDDELFNAMKKCPDFYAKLKPIYGSRAMFNYFYKLYGNDVEILTGIPGRDRGIYEASNNKIYWVSKYLNNKVVVNTVDRKYKAKFVKGKDCILVDDYQTNIDEWIGAGGTGILFKNPRQAKADIEKEIIKLQQHR